MFRALWFLFHILLCHTDAPQAQKDLVTQGASWILRSAQNDQTTYCIFHSLYFMVHLSWFIFHVSRTRKLLHHHFCYFDIGDQIDAAGYSLSPDFFAICRDCLIVVGLA